MFKIMLFLFFILMFDIIKVFCGFVFFFDFIKIFLKFNFEIVYRYNFWYSYVDRDIGRIMDKNMDLSFSFKFLCFIINLFLKLKVCINIGLCVRMVLFWVNFLLLLVWSFL